MPNTRHNTQREGASAWDFANDPHANLTGSGDAMDTPSGDHDRRHDGNVGHERERRYGRTQRQNGQQPTANVVTTPQREERRSSPSGGSSAATRFGQRLLTVACATRGLSASSLPSAGSSSTRPASGSERRKQRPEAERQRVQLTHERRMVSKKRRAASSEPSGDGAQAHPGKRTHLQEDQHSHNEDPPSMDADDELECLQCDEDDMGEDGDDASSVRLASPAPTERQGSVGSNGTQPPPTPSNLNPNAPDFQPRPLPPEWTANIPVPEGFTIKTTKPPPSYLRPHSPDSGTMVGTHILYLWPATRTDAPTWYLAVITESHVALTEKDRNRLPAFNIYFYADQKYCFASLAHDEYVDGPNPQPHQWVILLPDASTTMPHTHPSAPDTMGCGWPGCPGCKAAFEPKQLLEHIRRAHGGQIDDQRLAWTGGARCPACCNPFVSLRGHLRKDPSTGEHRCPTTFAARVYKPLLSSSDTAFINSLSDDDVYIQSTPSLEDIPHEVANVWAATIAPFMKAVVDDPLNDAAMRTLFVIWIATCRPQGAQRNRAEVIRRRCEALSRGGELQRLYSDIPQPRRTNVRHNTSGAPQGEASVQRHQRTPEQIRRGRAIHCVNHGEPGRARRALENSNALGVVDANDVLRKGQYGEVVEARAGSLVAEMIAKHPKPLPGSIDAQEITLKTVLEQAGVQHTEQDLTDMIDEDLDPEAFSTYVRKLEKCSMPSCDTIRFEHIRRFASSAHCDLLFYFAINVAKGRIPPGARPYLFGGRMLCPSKDDGGHRPIGAGACFRRMVVGFAVRTQSQQVCNSLEPVQLGVCVQKGTEIFATIIKTAIEDNPSWVTIKADFKNAFNEVSRIAFLIFAAQNFPALLLLLIAAYGAPSYITALGPAGWVRFLSSRGCTQGCPAGSLCFAAALQHSLAKVQQDFPDCVVVAIHDDVQICGPPRRAAHAMDALLQDASQRCGLTPSGHKFTIYSPSDCDDLREVERVVDSWTSQEQLDQGNRCKANNNGVVAAGVPIGSPDFINDTLQNKFASHQRAHEEVSALASQCAQCAYLILRYCLATRLFFWMRVVVPQAMTTAPDGSSGVTYAHDSRMWQTIAAVRARHHSDANDLSAECFRQAQLPPKDGGLGLHCMTMLCSAAYIAAAGEALKYMQLHFKRQLPTATQGVDNGLTPFHRALRCAYADWLRVTGTPPVRTLSSLLSDSPTQHKLSEAVHEKRAQDLLSDMTDAHKARFLSTGGQHAGTWLAAFPMNYYSRARSRIYKLALSIRLGEELPELATRSVSCGGCNCAIDPWGFHYGSCKNRGGLWTVRHDVTESAIIWGARHCKLQARTTKGAGNLFGIAATGNTSGGYKRADIIVDNMYGLHRSLYLDVAIVDPASKSSIEAGSAKSQGKAAQVKVQRKDSKYVPLAQHVGGHFKAAVLERFGAWSDDLVGFVKIITGDGERDPIRGDDWSFSTSSRTTHTAAAITFAMVMADAYMIDRLMEHDVAGRPLGGATDGRKQSMMEAARRGRSHRMTAYVPCFYEGAGISA